MLGKWLNPLWSRVGWQRSEPASCVTSPWSNQITCLVYFSGLRDRPRPWRCHCMAIKATPLMPSEQLLDMITKSDSKVRKPQFETIRFSTGQLPAPQRPWTCSTEAWFPPPPHPPHPLHLLHHNHPVTWNHYRHQQRWSFPSSVIIIKA